MRMRRLLRERWDLLLLLRLADPLPLTAFCVLGVVVVVVPLLIAVLTGSLVAGLRASGATMVTIVIQAALLALAIVLMQQASVMRDALNQRVAASIDGRVRSRVRFSASNVLSFDVVESAAFQTEAMRACDPGSMWRSRTAGAASIGQLWLMIRIVATLVLAVPLLTIDPVVAVVVTAGGFWINALERKQWVEHARILDAGAVPARDAEFLERSFLEPRYAREFAVFGFAPWLIRRWRSLTEDAVGPVNRDADVIVRRQWLTTFLGFAIGVVAFGLLGFDAVEGRLSAGAVTFAMVGVVTILGTIAFMGNEAWDIDYGLASVQAYRRLEKQAGATVVEESPDVTASAVPVVELSDVVFAFDPSRPVLNGVTLRLEPGERLALVGRNGAGKSTLTKLICGLYSPESGAVRFDGVPTSDPRARALATASVAVMYQESLRLPLDVRGNVTMGAPASDDEVWNALDVAGVADAIRGEETGLSTPLWNARGTSRDLSGGQWQRISLARAVFAAGRGKRILVLDEPTSQFDVYGETRFYEDVMAVLSGVSVILITHRLSTIRHADRIAMLDGGRIAEVGTHDQLVSRGGGYAAMFALQADRFRRDPS
jgi:ATP-binding cassette subfamily B protein